MPSLTNSEPALIRVTWEPPANNGGDKITVYCLELADESENACTFSIVYEGAQLEHSIEQSRLKPGAKYEVRVSCANKTGKSPWSRAVSFVCPATVPSRGESPKLVGKAKQNSAQIKWSPHELDGGSPILAYEVQMSGEQVYKGNDLACTLNGLLPDKKYFAQIRALNRIGAGEWSEPLEFVSGAGAPDAPQPPTVLAKSANCISVNWTEPSCNGLPITEYRLEWACCGKESEATFTQVYAGLALKHELKGAAILPATKYYFRLQAFNLNGPSGVSACVECLTPAAVPSMIAGVKIEEVKSDFVLVSWKQPASNGDPVTFYNIDLAAASGSANLITVYQVMQPE